MIADGLLNKRTRSNILKLSYLPIMLMLFASTAFAETELYFISPQNGDTVSGEFKLQFGLRGMGVAPAGVAADNTGHHHLLIDMEALPPMDVPLPKSDQLRHFGGGQTETSLSLAPGKHALQLVLGDYSHVPINPPVVSEKITITVIE
jgi:hypothetical protein